DGAGEQRLEPRPELRAFPRRDGARAHVVDLAVVAVQAEQQRRERAVLVPPEADDDAIRGAMLLHLDDRVARAWQVRRAEPLRDDAVEPERLEAGHPRARVRERARRRRA